MWLLRWREKLREAKLCFESSSRIPTLHRRSTRMRLLSFFAILLLSFSIRAQVNCQERDERVLTAEDFEDFRMIEGPQMDEETFSLNVSDKLPPFQFRIVP